jgi:hypothetical protein
MIAHSTVRPSAGSRTLTLALLFLFPLAACEPGAIDEPSPGSSEEPTTSLDSQDGVVGNERRGIGAMGSSEDEPISIARQAATIDGITIDPRKSLIITDANILGAFTLEGVLSQLAKQSGVSGLTALKLFQQWWDTANAVGKTGNPHCSKTFNGFQYTCPRTEEGLQASQNPFALDAPDDERYDAVALVNRFDLAAADGSDCGEYRIVFARRSGNSPATRNFLNFEGVLANPNPNPNPLQSTKPDPNLAKAGCRAIQLLWAEQSRPGRTLMDRIADLKKLYFTGISPFLPVVHIDNYGVGTSRLTGQIRTNQFLQPSWTLREFKLHKITGTAPALRFEIATTKNTPDAILFSPSKAGMSTTMAALKDAFDAFFPGMVKTLAVDDVNRFSMAIQDKFNTGDALAQDQAAQPNGQPARTNDYRDLFGKGPSPLRTSIQSKLTSLGSTLTPDDIVARAAALSCGGCHGFAGSAPMGGKIGDFPHSFGFPHTSEQTEPAPEGGDRYRISDALIEVFLPFRQAVMETFLVASDPAPRCGSSTGAWSGCRGTGCWVCAETTASFPYYFANHPACEKNTTCAGLFFTCNASCPKPATSDKSPTPGTCAGTVGQWKGCRGNGCSACSDALTKYPHYFANHPRCARNTTCAGSFSTCNMNCPKPTDADK